MSPEDELLTRTVIYVGLGIGAACMIAAIVIQTHMVHRGKATQKDVRDLVSTLGWTAFFFAATMLAHSGKPSAWMQAIAAALWTSLLVSLVPDWINSGAKALRAVASGWGIRAVPAVIYAAAYVSLVIFGIAYSLPAALLPKAVAVCAGSVGGLVWRAIRLAQASRPEDPPEAESLIIKASS